MSCVQSLPRRKASGSSAERLPLRGPICERLSHSEKWNRLVGLEVACDFPQPDIGGFPQKTFNGLQQQRDINGLFEEGTHAGDKVAVGLFFQARNDDNRQKRILRVDKAEDVPSILLGQVQIEQ